MPQNTAQAPYPPFGPAPPLWQGQFAPPVYHPQAYPPQAPQQVQLHGPQSYPTPITGAGYPHQQPGAYHPDPQMAQQPYFVDPNQQPPPQQQVHPNSYAQAPHGTTMPHRPAAQSFQHNPVQHTVFAQHPMAGHGTAGPSSFAAAPIPPTAPDMVQTQDARQMDTQGFVAHASGSAQGHAQTLQGGSRTVGRQPLQGNERDWPLGYEKREYDSAVEVPRNKYDSTKWSWRSNGFKENYDNEGVKASVYRCLGVYICTNADCRRPVRPLTQAREREAQLKNGCLRCSAPLDEGIKCGVKCYMYTLARPGNELGDLIVWEQKGKHEHVRPPAGSSLTPAEDRAVDEQVLRNPNATPLVYRTGDPGHGSVPLADINPHLADANAAAYAIRQSKTRLGITPALSTKEGSASLFKQLYTLNDDLGEEFLIYSRVHAQGVLVLQTRFMRSILEKTLDEWSSPESDKLVLGRRGFVTDGNHSFFREGVLLTTCAFSRELKKFVPVLFSHIQGEDEEHHRPHFEYLFKPIMERVKKEGIPFESHFLLNVMDFSQAQRNAHAEEYARAVCLTIPGWERLSPAAQAEQMEFLREEAKAAEKGCVFHFMEQATRVKNLLDPDRIEEYDRILHKMVRSKMPDDEFQAAVDFVHRELPDVWGWFSWWLRPSVIGMIFPSKSSTDPNVAALVPKTSNPVEHSHSLLNQATGKNNGLMEGIQKTFLLAQKFHKEDIAIKAGYQVPSGPRERKPKTTSKFYHNDGRGPDTVDALNNLQPAKHGFNKLTRLPLFAVMYKWVSPNSCFIDHGLEMFFRSYYLLDTKVRSDYRALFPSESFSFLLFEHCDLRLQLMTSNKKKNADATKLLTKTLASFQEVARTRIFKKWMPDWDPKGYHSALLWWQPLIEDGETTLEAQGFFALCTTVTYSCSTGHTQSEALPPSAFINLYGRIKDYARMLARHSGKETIELGEYLSEMVLFNRECLGLHASISTSPPCSSVDCTAPCAVDRINFAWPPVLTVESDIRSSSKPLTKENTVVSFPTSLKIADSQDSEVTYRLSGRVMHQPTMNHFTAMLSHGDSIYLLDDMKGTLRKSTSSTPWKRSGNEVYWVYVRTSQTSKTSQSSAQMLSNYEAYERQVEMGDLAKPLSLSSGSEGFGDDDPMLSESSLEEALVVKTKQRQLAPASTSKPKARKLAMSKDPKPSSQPLPPTANVGAISVPSCSTCAVRGEAAKRTVKCDVCLLQWHRVCVKHLVPEEHDLDGANSLFCCPQCVYPVNGRWDQLMIGIFILVDANDIAQRRSKGIMFYPARIVSRTDETVTLQWHEYNSWPPKSPKLSPTFTLTPQQCYQARHRDIFGEDCGEESFGAILWPIELHEIQEDEELARLNASNIDGLSAALKNAIVAVGEVVQHTRFHPITRLVSQWMEAAPQNALARQLRLVDFRTRFNIPLYPSHRSLAEYYAANIVHYLPSTGPTTVKLTPEDQMCAIILLELVVLRRYLKLDPSCDAELYDASRVLTDEEYDGLDDGEHALRARVVRELTIHEKAFQSSASNISGMREHHSKDTDSGQAKQAHQNASHLFKSQGLQLGRKLDRHGTIPVEHPSDLTKVLSEDGSRYNFGSVDHLWKDHMTLSGALPRRPPSPVSSVPRPFPLASSDNEKALTAGPAKSPKSVQTKLRIKIPAQPKALPSTKLTSQSKARTQSKKPKVQSTLAFAPRSLRKATMEKRTHSRRASNESDSAEEDHLGTASKKAKTD